MTHVSLDFQVSSGAFFSAADVVIAMILCQQPDAHPVSLKRSRCEAMCDDLAAASKSVATLIYRIAWPVHLQRKGHEEEFAEESVKEEVKCLLSPAATADDMKGCPEEHIRILFRFRAALMTHNRITRDETRRALLTNNPHVILQHFACLSTKKIEERILKCASHFRFKPRSFFNEVSTINERERDALLQLQAAIVAHNKSLPPPIKEEDDDDVDSLA